MAYYGEVSGDSLHLRIGGLQFIMSRLVIITVITRLEEYYLYFSKIGRNFIILRLRDAILITLKLVEILLL